MSKRYSGKSFKDSSVMKKTTKDTKMEKLFQKMDGDSQIQVS